MNPRQEKDFHQAKKEGDEPSHCNNKFPKNNIINSSSSRQFSSFKNPRIVRVSRACGGKDRHSKVCTVKGLRDRRIRLSVPTAIQLYDLQDRLGLGQPSKVVDWLIDATKNEIDKLPPLPDFPQFLHQESSSSLSLPDFPNNQDLNEQNFFPSNSQSNSVPNMPYNSNYLMNWDHHHHHHHPNLSLSQLVEGYNLFSFASQTDVLPANIPSYFPQFSSQIVENINDHHFQQNSILPTTLHLKSFSLDEINSKNVPSQDKDKRY